jgi:hypothetical protein
MNEQTVETATAEKLKFACTKCGAFAEPKCSCGAEYKFLPPSKLAEIAIKNNPNRSDRSIAAELGVSHTTVIRARQSTGTNVPVGDKRVGLDGKHRRVGKRESTRGRATPQLDKACAIIRKKIEANEPINQKKLQAEYGISHVTFDMAITAEMARKKLLDSEPIIDPTTLPKTAQAKLAAALRQQQREQTQIFEQRVAAEYQKRFDKHFPDMQKRYNEAYQAKSDYERFLGQQKKIMTRAEFMLLMMCVHDDPNVSAAKRTEAAQLLNAKRFALTGEK